MSNPKSKRQSLDRIESESEMMKAFEEFCDVREHALDYIETYENDELAQLVREKVLTIEEIEAGLRRRKYGIAA